MNLPEKNISKMNKLKQWSKMLTAVLLLIEFITWLIIALQIRKDAAYITTLADFTNTMVATVIPYFSLTAIERISNFDILKQIKKGD